MPLAEIGALLDAEPDQFAADLADVDRRLTDRIEELTARRAALRQLATGDRLLLPERACAILNRLTELGFSADAVAGQREALVLARALAPEAFDDFLVEIEQRLADPEYAELMKRCLEAESWDPDDPRLRELAADFSAKLLANRERLKAPPEFLAS